MPIDWFSRSSVTDVPPSVIGMKVSPPDLDRLIAGVSDKTTLEASVYISQGHPKWVIACASFCWEFDLGSQKWNSG